MGGGGRSLCSPRALWFQSSWPLEYGLCGAMAWLSLHGGLDRVPSFSGLPTGTPLGERTLKALSVLKAGSLRTWRLLPTPAPYVSVTENSKKRKEKKKKKKKNDSEKEDGGENDGGG